MLAWWWGQHIVIKVAGTVSQFSPIRQLPVELMLTQLWLVLARVHLHDVVSVSHFSILFVAACMSQDGLT